MDEKVLRLRLNALGRKLESEYFVAEEFIYNLDDVFKWMAEVPQWLNNVKQKAENLPENDPQRKELKMAILRNIAIAQARHKANDPIETRVYITKIEADWENVRDNETIERNNKTIVSHKRMATGGARGGSRDKTKPWATETANKLNEIYPNMTKEQGWLMIPESHGAWVIEAGEIDYEVEYQVYRDGKNLMARDINKKYKVDEEPSFITKATFFKNYYRK